MFQRLEKINVKLAALGGKLCKQSELKVDFNVEKYARQTISKNQKELNDFINNNWIEKCTSNPRLYNASKFRLASFHCCETEIKIQVGITSYKVKKMYFFHKNHVYNATKKFADLAISFYFYDLAFSKQNLIVTYEHIIRG